MIVLSVIFLAMATGLPAVQLEDEPMSGGRIAVVLDASESVRRTNPETLKEAQAQVAERLRAAAETVPKGSEWSGSVWTFGGAVENKTSNTRLSDLGASVVGADLSDLRSASNLQIALDRAIRDVSTGSGTGQIILVSDGHQTGGDVSQAVRKATDRGIPIHTYEVGSAAPSLGLLSMDLAPDQAIGRPAVLRATVQGKGRIFWGVNGEPEPAQTQMEFDAPTAVRVPVHFAERGLNFVDLDFAVSEQNRRGELAYALVKGPARILVYGGANWVELADRDRFVIERASPKDDVMLEQFDAVVIDALEPTDFDWDMPRRLLDAATGGVGIFIVNGPLRGTQEDMQRLSDWEQTVLGPVLPVNSDPAEYITEPPKRDIMIIVDTSESMSGPPMALARAAAIKIIDAARPQDSLTIVPFSTDAGRVFEAKSVGPNAANRARAFVRNLKVAGGTNMQAAIARARQLRGNNCALFIVGDGGYERGQIQGRPICFTTAIGVVGAELPGIDTAWGQQVPIRSTNQLGEITFEVFTPEPRTTFWEAGPFDVGAAEDPSDFEMNRPVSGAALSYPRPESTDLSIMANPPRAPVLAFRPDPDLRTLKTGVFLGVVPNGLPSGPEGWATHVFEELVGWDEPDLFDIEFDLLGEDAYLKVTFVGEGERPTKLGVNLLMPDGSSHGFKIIPSNLLGVFEGPAVISLPNVPARAMLNLELGGRDVQSIPIRLPARNSNVAGAVSTQEAFGFGVDSILMDSIRKATGGVSLKRNRLVLSRASAVFQPIPIWPWIAGLGILLFACSLFLGGVRR